MPHQHHTELNTITHSEEISEANTLLEFLQLGLHLDIGSDHLANFEKADRVSYTLPFCLEYVPTFKFEILPLEKVKLNGFKYIQSDVISQHYWHEISFRGPPTA